jgi:hypothetical protein
MSKGKIKVQTTPKVIRAMTFQEVIEDLKKAKPLTAEEMSAQMELAKAAGCDILMAFSTDVETCGNCGHQYTGKRLCPECGV